MNTYSYDLLNRPWSAAINFGMKTTRLFEYQPQPAPAKVTIGSANRIKTDGTWKYLYGNSADAGNISSSTGQVTHVAASEGNLTEGCQERSKFKSDLTERRPLPRLDPPGSTHTTHPTV